MKVFLQCLEQVKKFESLGLIAWNLCKDGCFVQDGVLTPDETPIVSFHPKYGYLRMDTHLEKSQIITVIMVKLMTFKYVLHPWKKWLDEYNPTENQLVVGNVRLFGSILYRMLLKLQDQLLDNADTKL
jgi:hypothetical protein